MCYLSQAWLDPVVAAQSRWSRDKEKEEREKGRGFGRDRARSRRRRGKGPAGGSDNFESTTGGEGKVQIQDGVWRWIQSRASWDGIGRLAKSRKYVPRQTLMMDQIQPQDDRIAQAQTISIL